MVTDKRAKRIATGTAVAVRLGLDTNWVPGIVVSGPHEFDDATIEQQWKAWLLKVRYYHVVRVEGEDLKVWSQMIKIG